MMHGQKNIKLCNFVVNLKCIQDRTVHRGLRNVKKWWSVQCTVT